MSEAVMQALMGRVADLERRLPERRLVALEERVLNVSLLEQHEAWTVPAGPSAEAFPYTTELTPLVPVAVPLPLYGVLRARRLIFDMQSTAIDGRMVFAIYRSDNAQRTTRDLPHNDEGVLTAGNERRALRLVRDLGAVDPVTGRRQLDFPEVQVSPLRALYFVVVAGNVAGMALNAPVQGQIAVGWACAPLNAATMEWPLELPIAQGNVEFQPAFGLYSAAGVMARGY
jgi:hypothetical protein